MPLKLQMGKPIRLGKWGVELARVNTGPWLNFLTKKKKNLFIFVYYYNFLDAPDFLKINLELIVLSKVAIKWDSSAAQQSVLLWYNKLLMDGMFL